MKLIIIGITDSQQPWFSPEVEARIACGKTFSGGRRHRDIMARRLPTDAPWIDITVPLSDVFDRYRALPESAQPLVVFASGDPLFFGFATTARRLMPDADIEVHPAFNSLQLLAHRLLTGYHDMRIVSLTGRPWQELDRALIERAPKIGVLTDRTHTPAAIARRLIDYGYDGYRMHLGEHLGHEEKERVATLTLQEAAGRECQQPNCLILEALSPGDLRAQRPFGIADSAFCLLDGRERMITKMPVRLLSLQALELPSRSVLWDIGFCTGSVSIEARLLFPHLSVVAFEVRPEGQQLMDTNSRRFGAPGITTVIGDFLQADLSALPQPDAVFIGGHGGQLQAVMERAASRLAEGGVMVMNSVKAAAVHTDSHRLWDDACRLLQLRQEPPLHIQLNNYNPIDILKCRKQPTTRCRK